MLSNETINNFLCAYITKGKGKKKEMYSQQSRVYRTSFFWVYCDSEGIQYPISEEWTEALDELYAKL